MSSNSYDPTLVQRLTNLDNLIFSLTKEGKPWSDICPLYKNRHQLLRDIAKITEIDDTLVLHNGGDHEKKVNGKLKWS